MSATPAGAPPRTTRPPAADPRVITFPLGLVGFRGPLRFAVQQLPGGAEWLRLLQCLDNPDLAFTLVDPFVFYPDYRPAASPSDLEECDLARVEDGIWMCIATIPTEIRQATVNLRAPLLINPFRRVGKQVVLVEPYPVRQPLLVRSGGLPAAGGGEGDAGAQPPAGREHHDRR